MTEEQLWAKMYTLELKVSNLEACEQHESDISRGDRLVASEYDHSRMVPGIEVYRVVPARATKKAQN